MVTAMAFAGTLNFNPATDSIPLENGKSFKFSAPKGEELPQNGFETGRETYLAPPENGSSVQVEIKPKSDRLQQLEKFDAWNGEDFVNLPILVKVKGKCTTDHISAAGPWLKYKGN